MIGRPVQVRGTSYAGDPHWSHPAYLVLQRDRLIVTQTFAGTEVTTRNGPWTSPFDTRGHYWSDRWYNVIRLEAPRGGERSTSSGSSPSTGSGRSPSTGSGRGLQGFYCNVATPAEFDGENLHYCDLQIDVRASFEGGRLRYEVWDEDEFEEARGRFAYPESVVRQARAAVDELVRLIEARQFPFNV